MTISFTIPGEIEDALRRRGRDPSVAFLEAAVVGLYRQRQITHHQLATALGLGRIAADEVLKRHDVPLDQTVEDVQSEIALLRRDRSKDSRG